jgi:hypothetical protein
MSGWVAGGIVVGSALSSRASSKAASTQAASADRAGEVQKDVADQQIALQREQFNRQIELQQPFRDVGLRALNKLEGATDYTPFGMKQFQADPGYAFRMSEGMKGLERSAAARGGLLSGATMKGIQRFGQDLGSQEYQNAFNRYQAERQSRLNPLQSLAGVGQTSANVLGQAGQSMTAGIGGALGAYGQGASEAIGAAGQARASGYVGQANALTGALGQYMNYSQQQQQNALLRQAIGGGGTMSGIGANIYSGQGPYGYAP